MDSFNFPALPVGVPVDQVYTDYLRYLFRHTKAFFEEHIFNGQDIWQSLSASMAIIIAHPNGWGAHEQSVLRAAAVAAGISTAVDSRRKITFVSEAEASVQFCLSSSLVGSLEVSVVLTILEAETDLTSQPGMNLVVCDAGGSTVDTTVYTVIATEPMLQLEEIKASACNIFVWASEGVG
jgi:hypothetical protein